MRSVHIFKDFYPPTTGGIEQHMRLLCAGLARHMEVTVLVPSRSRRRIRERIDGVSVIRVPEFGRYASAPFCPTLPVELRRLRPDITHLHFPNPMGDLGYLLSGWRAPLVLTYHADIVKQRFLLPLYRPVLRLVFARVRRIIATSTDYIASSDFLSRYRNRCTVIPFGVDLKELSLRDGEAAAVERVRSEHGGRLILFVGVLRYYKGLDVLVRAMEKVQGHLMIVGRGSERNDLERLADQLGIAGRITFLGEIPEPRLRILRHACDVFVLPSIDRCEAFGIAQLEAMACEKPVVSSDLPTGVRLVNRHGVTGLLVPPRDPVALAEALSRLLEDPALRVRLGRAARHRVEREFTAERMIARTLEVYREVLAPRVPDGARRSNQLH
jgi:glycosyltransferase involved in cell wall biosynthesis